MTSIKLMQLKFTIPHKKLMYRLVLFSSIFIIVLVTDILYVTLPWRI